MTIHALPGMGGDHRMFPAPWHRLPKFVAHDWLHHTHDQSLPEAARSVAEAYRIGEDDIVIGTSLGGMVACEIAKSRNLRALFLVASATHKDEVTRLLQLLHPLARITPFEWIRAAAGKIPADVARMFAQSDVGFVRTMCSAVFAWDGVGEERCRCFRVHGRYDRVIRPPQRADLLLDGGHLITMTHAEECVRFVESQLPAL